MKHGTQEYLERANENRLLAERIVADSDSSPGLLRWASVMTFYAALQYVNAYLFEQWDTAPGNHAERENAMLLFKTTLRPVVRRYLTLKAKAGNARYQADSQFSANEIRDLLDNELHAIRVAVLNNLPS